MQESTAVRQARHSTHRRATDNAEMRGRPVACTGSFVLVGPLHTASMSVHPWPHPRGRGRRSGYDKPYRKRTRHRSTRRRDGAENLPVMEGGPSTWPAYMHLLVRCSCQIFWAISSLMAFHRSCFPGMCLQCMRFVSPAVVSELDSNTSKIWARFSLQNVFEKAL